MNDKPKYAHYLTNTNPVRPANKKQIAFLIKCGCDAEKIKGLSMVQASRMMREMKGNQ